MPNASDNQTAPSISVIVPTRNRPKMLVLALESIALQTFRDYEVLCVMHERDCLARSGMFSEYLEAHEDWDLWLRMARHYVFAHIPAVTCAYTRKAF